MTPEEALEGITAHHAKTMAAILAHNADDETTLQGIAEAIFDQALLLTLAHPEYAAALAGGIHAMVRRQYAAIGDDLPRAWPITRVVAR